VPRRVASVGSRLPAAHRRWFRYTMLASVPLGPCLLTSDFRGRPSVGRTGPREAAASVSVTVAVSDVCPHRGVVPAEPARRSWPGPGPPPTSRPLSNRIRNGPMSSRTFAGRPAGAGRFRMSPHPDAGRPALVTEPAKGRESKRGIGDQRIVHADGDCPDRRRQPDRPGCVARVAEVQGPRGPPPVEDMGGLSPGPTP
jgi:hypothetical protein